MRLSRDLIFLCGQRRIPNSLHLLLRAVSPTFKCIEACLIGTSKYMVTSDKVILDMSLLVALFFFLSTTPAELPSAYQISNIAVNLIFANGYHKWKQTFVRNQILTRKFNEKKYQERGDRVQRGWIRYEEDYGTKGKLQTHNPFTYPSNTSETRKFFYNENQLSFPHLFFFFFN